MWPSVSSEPSPCRGLQLWYLLGYTSRELTVCPLSSSITPSHISFRFWIIDQAPHLPPLIGCILLSAGSYLKVLFIIIAFFDTRRSIFLISSTIINWWAQQWCSVWWRFKLYQFVRYPFFFFILTFFNVLAYDSQGRWRLASLKDSLRWR